MNHEQGAIQKSMCEREETMRLEQEPVQHLARVAEQKAEARTTSIAQELREKKAARRREFALPSCVVEPKTVQSLRAKALAGARAVSVRVDGAAHQVDEPMVANLQRKAMDWAELLERQKQQTKGKRDKSADD